MKPIACPGEPSPSFPRYFKIGGWVSAYKFFLCIGICTGVFVSAAVAEQAGISPLRIGVGCLSCALVGMFGARIYHLLVFARHYSKKPSLAHLWNPRHGGWSVFGGLIIVPYSFLLSNWLQIPLGVYWDLMIFGIASGAVWIRFGCVWNGCCCGKETSKWYGIAQHNIRGICVRRIPVPWIEIGWWLAAFAAIVWIWPAPFPAGSYALGVLGWYGLGRVWLEPLREAPDRFAGRLLLNQLVAILLAVVAGILLVL